MNIEKKDIKYYGTIIVLLVIIILVEIFKEKPIDWTFNLEHDSKEPYGTYVLYKSLPDLFPEVEKNNFTIFQAERNNNYQNTNFIFISQNFAPEESDLRTILKLAEKGNNIFISAYRFSGAFADSLNIKSYSHWRKQDSVLNCSFTNIALKDSIYTFGENFQNFCFSKTDTANSKILGYQDSKVNFLKQSYGKGHFYLNTQTAAFTNYGLITSENPGYAFNALSHLPPEKIVWDTYYKPFKEQQKSPLRFLFKQKALIYAWYTILISLLIFMVFSSKRRQRIIPIIRPLKNTSVEFAETLSRLYYHNKNHRQIALNKFKYLKENISRIYYIQQSSINTENVQFLEEKTDIKAKYWQQLFISANRIEQSKKISAEILAEFNTLAEKIYKI